MTLESALRRAVLQKDFLLHYQPQVDLESGEILAVEALVRWRTEDSGTVMPGDFIPLAEETGLINEIGEWVLREGCRQMKEWQDRGLKPRRIAVNLSARQFAERAFLDTVMRVLQDTGLDPRLLELEITESQVMRQTEGMILLLNRLAEMGVHLAIDDFGTGYSSLSYLKRLPIQMLKIDQSFIRDITVDPNDTAIVVAIINMARSLELETIAEGVETAGQLALLRSKGCRIGQGFYFSAPVSADGLYPLLKRNNLYARAGARIP
jgi:EAL domain-containing protein (putative c-di-GMP-specific phosphodiesterase class I)